MKSFLNISLSLYVSFFIVQSESALASTTIETPLIRPYNDPDFETLLALQESRFNTNLTRLPPAKQTVLLELLDVSTKAVTEPVALSESDLADILCHIRSGNAPGQNLQRVPFFRCNRDGMSFGSSGFSADIGTFGRRGKKFVEFVYFLNLNPPSFISWHRARILDFLSFSIEAGTLDLPTAANFEAYLEQTLSKRFAPNIFWQRLNRPALEVKTVSIPNGITYVPSLNSVPVAEGLAGLTPSGGFPSVHRAATCAGYCVALDKSSFSSVIGTHSYAWQILFYSDVWPEFLSDDDGYPGIASFDNIIWFLWADFVAGSEASTTLRATQFFKEALDPFVTRIN
jgi:hypothetical protein